MRLSKASSTFEALVTLAVDGLTSPEFRSGSIRDVDHENPYCTVPVRPGQRVAVDIEVIDNGQRTATVDIYVDGVFRFSEYFGFQDYGTLHINEVWVPQNRTGGPSSAILAAYMTTRLCAATMSDKTRQRPYELLDGTIRVVLWVHHAELAQPRADEELRRTLVDLAGVDKEPCNEESRSADGCRAVKFFTGLEPYRFLLPAEEFGRQRAIATHSEENPWASCLFRFGSCSDYHRDLMALRFRQKQASLVLDAAAAQPAGDTLRGVEIGEAPMLTLAREPTASLMGAQPSYLTFARGDPRLWYLQRQYLTEVSDADYSRRLSSVIGNPNAERSNFGGGGGREDGGRVWEVFSPAPGTLNDNNPAQDTALLRSGPSRPDASLRDGETDRRRIRPAALSHSDFHAFTCMHEDRRKLLLASEPSLEVNTDMVRGRLPVTSQTRDNPEQSQNNAAQTRSNARQNGSPSRGWPHTASFEATLVHRNKIAAPQGSGALKGKSIANKTPVGAGQQNQHIDNSRKAIGKSIKAQGNAPPSTQFKGHFGKQRSGEKRKADDFNPQQDSLKRKAMKVSDKMTSPPRQSTKLNNLASRFSVLAGYYELLFSKLRDAERAIARPETGHEKGKIHGVVLARAQAYVNGARLLAMDDEFRKLAYTRSSASLVKQSDDLVRSHLRLIADFRSAETQLHKQLSRYKSEKANIKDLQKRRSEIESLMANLCNLIAEVPSQGRHFGATYPSIEHLRRQLASNGSQIAKLQNDVRRQAKITSERYEASEKDLGTLLGLLSQALCDVWEDMRTTSHAAN